MGLDSRRHCLDSSLGRAPSHVVPRADHSGTPAPSSRSKMGLPLLLLGASDDETKAPLGGEKPPKTHGSRLPRCQKLCGHGSSLQPAGGGRPWCQRRRSDVLRENTPPSSPRIGGSGVSGQTLIQRVWDARALASSVAVKPNAAAPSGALTRAAALHKHRTRQIALACGSTRAPGPPTPVMIQAGTATGRTSCSSRKGSKRRSAPEVPSHNSLRR